MQTQCLKPRRGPIKMRNPPRREKLNHRARNRNREIDHLRKTTPQPPTKRATQKKMGIGLDIKEAEGAGDRGQGHVRVKGLNDVESRSWIPSNFPK